MHVFHKINLIYEIFCTLINPKLDKKKIQYVTDVWKYFTWENIIIKINFPLFIEQYYQYTVSKLQWNCSILFNVNM